MLAIKNFKIYFRATVIAISCFTFLSLLTQASEFLQPKKILILDSQIISPYKEVKNATLIHLKELGYVEGKNLTIEQVNIGNFIGAAINTLRSSNDQNYNLYFINGTLALQGTLDFIAKNPNHPPIIFANVTDPISLGAISHFNRPPKQKITGVSYPVSIKKRFYFLKSLMPKVKTIGYIYADMPQSTAYISWIEKLFKDDESLKGIRIIYKKIDFIKSANGHKRMVFLAEKALTELDPLVDVYVSPNDQLGSTHEFSQMIYKQSKKPIFGLANEPYTIASLSPDFESNGKILAKMISRIFQGENISNIYPQESHSKVCINFDIIKRYPSIELSKNLSKKNQSECFAGEDLKVVR